MHSGMLQRLVYHNVILCSFGKAGAAGKRGKDDGRCVVTSAPVGKFCEPVICLEVDLHLFQLFLSFLSPKDFVC